MQARELPHQHNQRFEREFDHMPQPEQFFAASEIFKLLGDGTRARLFWLLCHCEECVLNLSAMMEMSSPAISHHLRLLKSCGLISSRRDGKEVYYKAASNDKADALHNMIERVVEISCPEQQTKQPAADIEQGNAIQMIHSLLTSNLSRRYTIDELARLSAMNTSALKQQFKAAYGQPIAAYMKHYRIRKAEQLLTSGEKSLSEIAAALGYRSQSRFSEAFKSVTGALPSEYKKQL